MRVRRVESRDRAEWLRMRNGLWPDQDGHESEIDAFLAKQSQFINEVFVCEAERAKVIGFVELRIRNYAEGSYGTEVPHVEGWYVDEGHRGQGVGAALIERAEQWAVARGYSELASDAEIENSGSLAAHRALGFEEMDRIVCFLKKL